MSDSDRPSFDPMPRAITPLAEFDSRPKIAAAKSIDPLAEVARLFPRDPRSPSEFERQRLERASRDTEPTDLLGDDDDTPADRPFEIRVERELEKLRKDVDAIKKSFRDTAQHTVDMHELVKAIDRRQRAFDVERRWVPWVFRLATFGLALWALIRTYR